MGKQLLILTILGLLTSCSDTKLQPAEKVTSDEEIMQSIEEIPAGADPVGTLTFFPGDERGVVVKGVRWGQPVGSENPGADCELVPEGQEGFGCSPKKGVDTAHLSVQERDAGGHRGVYRIVLKGRGQATRDRWINQLGINGFIRQGQKVAEGARRNYYTSSDRRTRAELEWVAKTEEITVTLGPPAGK